MNRRGDFIDFVTAAPVTPSHKTTQRIFELVNKDIGIALPGVIIKLVLIQTLAGIVTLVFCPQFGVGPWGGFEGVTHFIARLSLPLCAAFCGTLFMGTGSVVSALLLRPAENRVIQKRGLWIFPALAVFYWVLLMLAGAGVQGHVHSSVLFVTVWIASGSIAAILFDGLLGRLRWALQRGTL